MRGRAPHGNAVGRMSAMPNRNAVQHFAASLAGIFVAVKEVALWAQA
jgi:hypothetical protein